MYFRRHSPLWEERTSSSNTQRYSRWFSKRGYRWHNWIWCLQPIRSLSCDHQTKMWCPFSHRKSILFWNANPSMCTWFLKVFCHYVFFGFIVASKKYMYLYRKILIFELYFIQFYFCHSKKYMYLYMSWLMLSRG